MLRISCHPGQIFKRVGYDEGFAMLREAGIEAIQYGMGAELLSKKMILKGAPSILDGPMDEILEFVRPVKEASKKYNVAISQVHAPFPAYMPGNEELNERLRPVLIKSVQLAEYFESPHVLVHPSKLNEGDDLITIEEEWEQNRGIYEGMMEALKEHNVVCLLENLFAEGSANIRFAAASSDFPVVCDWIDKLNEEAGEKRFAFCLDTGHATLARQNLYRAIKLLGHRLEALHMQDNSGYLDEHTAPYTGIIRWDLVLQGLKEIGYRGDLNFEAGKAIEKYPPEMHDICLKMLARTGEYFRKQILSE